MMSTQHHRHAAPWMTVCLVALSSHTAASPVDAVAFVSAAVAAGDDDEEEVDAGVPLSLLRPAADPHRGRRWLERRTGSPIGPVHRQGHLAAAWLPSLVEGTSGSRRYEYSHQQPVDWRRRHLVDRLSSPLTWNSVEEALRCWSSSTALKRPGRHQQAASARSCLPRTLAVAAALNPAGKMAGAAGPSARPRGRTSPPRCPARWLGFPAGDLCGWARRGWVAGAEAAAVAAVGRGCPRRRKWCLADWTS